MNYSHHESFLSLPLCHQLINDASKFVSMDKVSNIHGGRISLPSSDPKFAQLFGQSIAWRDLMTKINSDNFLTFCCEQLSIDSKSLNRVTFYNTMQPGKFERHFKLMSKEEMCLNSNFKICTFIAYRLIKRALRFFKFSLRIFGVAKPVELLFDYSIASNGYGREIHRDSDSRMIVFLIYLNDLSPESTGGNLEIYKYSGSSGCIPSQPDKKDCILIKSFDPTIGKLVIFENTSESLHAVPELKNNEGHRNFIYGAFTLLAGKNPNLKNCCNSMKTPFEFYT